MLKKIALATAVLALSSASFAGNWTVKVGGSLLAPDSDNGTLNIGGTTVHPDVSSEYNFTPSVEYRFADTPFSVELLLATPFKHDVKLPEAGAEASFKHLPPTLTAKYNLPTYKGFTPYIGAGVTVVVPWDEEVKGSNADLEADDVSVAAAGQVGFIFQPADAKNWGVYADVRYANVETDLELDGTDIGTLEVNPWVYTVGLSYNF